MHLQKKSTSTAERIEPVKKIFLARQPIFDRNIKVAGYELLFRSGFENEYDTMQNGDSATSTTLINSFVHFGIDTITNGKPAYINFTKNLILDGTADIFPKELLTVEVLENVIPDSGIIEACKRMKHHGYTIALDDFSMTDGIRSLIDLADIIKIDFRVGTSTSRANMISNIGNNKIKFLAEKVETYEEFSEAKGQGFTLFQGYFFSKPKIIEGVKIHGNKFIYIRILSEINDPDVSFETLEHIVKRDISLTYKLLRLINSAAFGFRVKITSIKQALTLLGLIEFKKMGIIDCVDKHGRRQTGRAFCYNNDACKILRISRIKNIDEKPALDIFFLLGMLSNIDAYLDIEMSSIVEKLPIDNSMKDALCGKDGYLNDILQSVIAYEKGSWDEWKLYLAKCGISGDVFPEIYANSADWVKKILQ